MAVNLHKSVSDQGNYFFLSYKKENAELLKKIVEKLRFNVWYDFGINCAEVWTEEIVRHLKQSQAVILFLSRDVLKPGVESFVYLEYNVAMRNHKDVMVVYLEDINDDDIPDSLAVWFEKLNTSQCLMYRADRSLDEWVEQIHQEVTKFSQRKKETALPPEPRQLTLSLCSNLADDQFMYLGTGDGHLSTDRRKICLYNEKSRMFEVRLMDNYGYLVSSFKQKPEMIRDSRIFYTPQNDYIFFMHENRIYIYNILKQKWEAPQGIKIKLDKGEVLKSMYEAKPGGCIFLFTQKDDYMYRILLFNVREGKLEKSWDLRHLRLRKEVCTLSSRTTDIISYCNADDEIVTIDLRKMETVHLTSNQMLEFLHEPDYLLSDVDDRMSHDGSLYTASTGRNIRVLDMHSGKKVDEDYVDNLRRLYLLNNGTVLKFDLQGNVYTTTVAGKTKIFDKDYFLSKNEFSGHIPHTMFYDELRDQFVFVTMAAPDTPTLQRVVVVDRHGHVLLISNNLVVPFSLDYVSCTVVRNELIVIFSSAHEKYKQRQSTIIYRGEYR